MQIFESFDCSDSFDQDAIVYVKRNQVVTIESQSQFSDSWLLDSLGSHLLKKINIENLLSNLLTHLLYRLFPSLHYSRIRLVISTILKQRQVISDLVNKSFNLENFDSVFNKINFKDNLISTLIFTNQIIVHVCFIYGFFKTGFSCLVVSSYYFYKNNNNLKAILIIWVVPVINISGLTLAAYMGCLESIPLGLQKIMIVVESLLNYIIKKQPVSESHETDGLNAESTKSSQKAVPLATSSIPTGPIPPSDESNNDTNVALPLTSLERSSIRREPGDFANRPSGPMQRNPGYSDHVTPGPVSRVGDRPYPGNPLDKKSLQAILLNSQKSAKNDLENKKLEDKKEGLKIAKKSNIDLDNQDRLWDLSKIENKNIPYLEKQFAKFDYLFTRIILHSPGTTAAYNLIAKKFEKAYSWRPLSVHEMNLAAALDATRTTLDKIVLEKKKQEAERAELREQCKQDEADRR